jgi:hypothetical protein
MKEVLLNMYETSKFENNEIKKRSCIDRLLQKIKYSKNIRLTP